ncbi:CTNA1 protein, partial [Scopus umbretta]|nr:CTNA1 protein [Scopus umbretta]
MQAASWLLECLSVLRDAGDMPGVLAAFRAFSEALLLLSNLTAKRLEELGDCPRQKSLAQTLQLLQKGIPLLHAAKHSDLKHSWDRQVNLSKDYAFQLTERTIKELTSLLVDRTGSKEPRDRTGTFSQHVSRLLALLSRPDPAHLSDSELSAHAEAVVFFCMLLADSSRPDLKLDLVKHCWVLLRLRKSVCSHVSQQEGWPGQRCGESSLEKECHAMREEVETLDQAALTATLCQILDTFFVGKEPLRQLVDSALSLAGTGCLPAGQGGFLKKLQPFIATFFTHAQQMLRAADFVLARCTKTQTAREIGEWVEYLKRLLASLPPLLAEMSRNTAQTSAAEQLQSLYHAWAGTTESLLRCFEETVSMREFLRLSVQEMSKRREWCEKALESQDPERLSWHATHLTSWARWVVEATTRYVDRATDPIFRNGLLVWVEQLANSVLELKAVATLCPERLSCLQTREVFSKAASCLMDTARRVRDGLDGSNHPDILSPLRAQVRSTDVAKALELSPSHTGLKTATDEAALQDDISSHPSPRAGILHPDVVPRKGDTHPVITALLAAARAHDTAAVDAACSAVLELSNGCIDAAKEALPVAESPQMETLGQYQKIVLLTPCVISLARETAPRQLRLPSRLLRMALTLSERICETKECLAAVAGSWYRLSQQVFGFILSADFLRGKQALDETMTGLAGAVQLTGDIASVACSKGNPISPNVWESFLQVQAKFSRAQMNTKVLLEKAASFEGSCRVGKASLELHCVQWAVGMRVLLGAVDRFIGRDVLFLRELRSAVKNRLCSQSLLAAVSENSLRLQEAARLSYLSCPEDRSEGRSEILALREEIKVLTEALLDVSDTLSASPLSTASLYVRFELLQRDLALRAKALLLHLEKVNAEHLWVIRDVVGPALSPLSQEEMERSKQAFEEKAGRLMGNVQWVRTTLREVLEASAQLQSQANLLSVADHLLVLTSDAVGSARQLFQSCRDKRHLHLDSIVWYWSANAHYLVTQLRTVQGIRGHILQLIRQRLQNAGDQRSPSQRNSTAKLFPARELDALSHTKSAETSCPSRSGRASGAAREAREMGQ